MLDVSVVIPTLNARRTLGAAIASVRRDVREIVVTDGGSADGTAEAALDAGAILVTGPPGRGGQLRRGAEAASASWLLFLHADTVLEPTWAVEAAHIMEQPQDRAAYFRFRLDDGAPQARRLERMVAWRSRALGLPYGDQGLLISRTFYGALGGFRDMPLLEDVDLVRRIGRHRLMGLSSAAITSAEKFRRDGYWRRSARNLTCLALYFAGVSPARIKRIYE